MKKTPTNYLAKILIVEDDAYLADVYGTKFEKEGFEVKIAEDGETGIQMTFDWSPDIVLLDIMLPKMDGLDVLRELKASKDTKNIPIVMWTNKSDSVEAKHAKEMGAVDYLVKVYNMPSEVVNKVKGYLK